MEGPGVLEEIKILQKEVHCLMDQDDMKWGQRVKRHWFKHRDQNTKYFHACADHHRAKNFIKHIVDEQSMVHDQAETIEEAFRSYFAKIFTTSALTSQDIAHCCNNIRPKVIEDMNRRLFQKFTADEVQQTLTQMAQMKSLRHDKFGAVFYQKHWQTIGLEVCEAALHLLNDAGTFSPINNTLLL